MSDISFDENYRDSGCYWGEEPSSPVKGILDYISSGEALVLGVGEGRNALFLAKNGFKVVGVDKSREGIKKFLKLVGKGIFKTN